MSIQVGDTLLQGRVIVIGVDTNNLITKIRIPLLGDGINPFELTFNPGQSQNDVELISQTVIDLLS